MDDVPQDVLDAVERDGEEVMVKVADAVLTATFTVAVAAGYKILGLVVGDGS